MNWPTAQILLAEDNSGDVCPVREAVKEVRVGASLHVCRDGVDALGYRRQPC